MDRRRFLGSLVTLLTLGVAGCGAPGAEGPAVTPEEGTPNTEETGVESPNGVPPEARTSTPSVTESGEVDGTDGAGSPQETA